ncbi:MAG TPA: PKD domain-containing protein [Chloroflexi bacterium]|nr:PKD domain-containing protein [Chloroflexota bacterium]
MKSRGVGLALALALGVALALLWAIGTRQEVATAASAPAVQRAGAAPAPAAPAATLQVCPSGCAYSSIQAAVDAANPNDTILVAAGTYTGVQQRDGITQVVYISKSLTIRGGYTVTNWTDPDPLLNISRVDAEGLGRVMVINGPITVHIEGLHIAGGDATGLGGGPWTYDGVGGGLYVVSANVTISDCVIDSNVASNIGWGGGGGIFLWDTTATVVNNRIGANVASRSLISPGDGGGVAIAGGNVTLEGNRIYVNKGNDAPSTPGPGNGGGVFIAAGDPVLKRNRIDGNEAGGSGSYGGGIAIKEGTHPVLINNALVDNQSSSSGTGVGAGIYVGSSALVRLLHTTVASNTGGDGSGIYVDGGTAALTNTIIAGQAVGITTTNGSTVTVNGILWHGNGQNTGGPGAIDVQNEYTGNPALDSYDHYHIPSTSAARDKGVDAGIDQDIDGQDRPYGAKPDLGADEWWPTAVGKVLILGTNVGFVDLPEFFNAWVEPQDATPPITYTWSPTPNGGGQGTAWVTYTWATTGTYVITVTAQNVVGSAITTTTITIRSDLTTTLYPTADVTLIYTDPWGLTTTLYAPTGTVARSWILRYTPRPSHVFPLLSDMGFGGHAFDLDVLSNTLLITSGFEFSRPLTITIRYTDSNIAGLDEESLRLYFWNGSQWVDGATTCIPTSTYRLYTQENRLELAICHLSRWGMMGMTIEGKKKYIYLPLILRDYP